MADETTQQPAQQFGLQRIYVKDLSFETPQGVEVFRQAWKPRVNLEMNTRQTRIDENNFEVVLTLSVTASQEEKTAFLVEVQQAGIFTVSGLPEPQMRQVLATVCPSILFPYAREAIDNLVTRGSFPPIMLAPVNFDLLYAQALKQAQEKAQGEGAAAPSPAHGDVPAVPPHACVRAASQRSGAARKPELAPRLVHDHRDRIRQVDAATPAALHRQAQALRGGQCIEQFLRQAAGLGPEQEGIPRSEARRIVARARARAERKDPGGSVRLAPRLEAVPAAHARPLVVIEAGTAQPGVVHLEAERLDQVQARAGVGAQADHVAGVGRNLRLVKHHLEHRDLAALVSVRAGITRAARARRASRAP